MVIGLVIAAFCIFANALGGIGVRPAFRLI
jgi:hypothetical protein